MNRPSRYDFWNLIIAIIAILISILSLFYSDIVERSKFNFTIYNGKYDSEKYNLSVGTLWNNEGNQDIIILDRHICYKNLVIDNKSYPDELPCYDGIEQIEMKYTNVNYFTNPPIYIKPKEQLVDNLDFCSCSDQLKNMLAYIEQNREYDINFHFDLFLNLCYIKKNGIQTWKSFKIGYFFYNNTEHKVDCNLYNGKINVYTYLNFKPFDYKNFYNNNN